MIPLMRYQLPTKQKEVSRKCIIQKYIENPLLVKKKKFVFKAYVLVLNSSPLVCMYKPGFINLASRNYDGSKTRGQKCKQSHYPCYVDPKERDEGYSTMSLEQFEVRSLNFQLISCDLTTINIALLHGKAEADSGGARPHARPYQEDPLSRDVDGHTLI